MTITTSPTKSSPQHIRRVPVSPPKLSMAHPQPVRRNTVVVTDRLACGVPLALPTSDFTFTYPAPPPTPLAPSAQATETLIPPLGPQALTTSPRPSLTLDTGVTLGVDSWGSLSPVSPLTPSPVEDAESDNEEHSASTLPLPTASATYITNEGDVMVISPVPGSDDLRVVFNGQEYLLTPELFSAWTYVPEQTAASDSDDDSALSTPVEDFDPHYVFRRSALMVGALGTLDQFLSPGDGSSSAIPFTSQKSPSDDNESADLDESELEYLEDIYLSYDS
ncbi:hypothetical protein BDN72DRAFT_903108 [Pluteus cervinus]|uniref:Uncharacterized protein n=1 Tax=Pluteus cervinus TaxID=181527 RepID=A0ACD3A9Q4_9AGAR|nr:hypothetical protein BDN72DRAFT_903108 [Pluteus cervinus]